VLADPTLQIVGKKVAEDPDRGLAVYRVNGLLRTSTVISGWYDDTWTAPSFSWTRRDCTGGLLRVPVHTSAQLYAGVTQRIAVSGSTTPFIARLPSTATRTIGVRLAPQHGVCRVRFDVSPARRPAGDPRTLGVLVSGFEYLPSP
jgi:hypothetical protein